jgi:hypothetical protein
MRHVERAMLDDDGSSFDDWAKIGRARRRVRGLSIACPRGKEAAVENGHGSDVPIGQDRDVTDERADPVEEVRHSRLGEERLGKDLARSFVIGREVERGEVERRGEVWHAEVLLERPKSEEDGFDGDRHPLGRLDLLVGNRRARPSAFSKSVLGEELEDVVLSGVELAKEHEVHDRDEDVEGEIGRLKLTLFGWEEGTEDGIDAFDDGGVRLLAIAADEIHPEKAEGAVSDDGSSFRVLSKRGIMSVEVACSG